MIHGVINIYKERGYTSHDVVGKLRGILKQKKIGHTGTLDPDAEGVLPVCLGKATKLCDLLTDKEKTYRAVLLLGKNTDTQDISGRVLSEQPVTADEETVRGAVMSFVGAYDQIPPMYSALKVNGQKLCDLARAGKEVERKPRRVTIREIRVEQVELPRVTMEVTCSKGTYIRTLCQDIGEKLGCGGCMESLLRTRVDRFCLEEAIKLGEVEALKTEKGLEGLMEKILPIDGMFAAAPKAVVLEEGMKALVNGNTLRAASVQTEQPVPDGERVRVYDVDGRFYALYRYEESEKQYRLEKMFYDRENVYSAITKIIKSPISTRILPVFFSLRNFFFFKSAPSFVFFMSFTHILFSFSSKYSEHFIISQQHIVPLSIFQDMCL